MAKVESEFTKKFTDKFLEFQKNGLTQYSKYLDAQLKWAEKSDIRAHYKKYIESQIELTEKQIKAIDAKL